MYVDACGDQLRVVFTTYYSLHKVLKVALVFLFQDLPNCHHFDRKEIYHNHHKHVPFEQSMSH